MPQFKNREEYEKWKAEKASGDGRKEMGSDEEQRQQQIYLKGMTRYFSGSVIVRILAVALLLWALDRHPYGYYKLLRWAVCGANVYAGLIALDKKKKSWVWIFGIMALLFNPIIPFRLDRDTWHVIDLIVAVILGLSTFIVREND